jgi:hypothetical protein
MFNNRERDRKKTNKAREKKTHEHMKKRGNESKRKLQHAVCYSVH